MRVSILAVLLCVLPALSKAEPWIGSCEAPVSLAVDVGDVDAAIAWYTRAFGVELLDDTTSGDELRRTAILSNDYFFVELTFDARSSSRGAWNEFRGITKVGFPVPDVRAIADRVEADTGDRPDVLELEPRAIRLIELHDPEGNIIQLHSPLDDEPDGE